MSNATIDILLWRLVIDNNVSLKEIENYWTLDDVFEANEYLDIKQEIEQLMMQSGQENKQSNGTSFSIKV